MTRHTSYTLVLTHACRKWEHTLPEGSSPNWSVSSRIIDNVRGELQKRQWIIFDGDVDPEWVENLNSVLDDNKLLTLPNGERLSLPPNVRPLYLDQYWLTVGDWKILPLVSAQTVHELNHLPWQHFSALIFMISFLLLILGSVCSSFSCSFRC